MDRRDFILDSCRACAALIALPAIATLDGCAPTKKIAYIEEGSMVRIAASEFATRTTAVIRPKGLMDPLLVVKETSGGYKALLLKCTHKGQRVALSGSGLVCDAHGSQFDLEGKVTKGPAKTALKEYPVVVNSDQLEIELKA